MLKEMIYFVDQYLCSSPLCHALGWQPGNDGPHDGGSPSGDDKVGRSSHTQAKKKEKKTINREEGDVWFIQQPRIREEEEVDGMGDWREHSARKRIHKLSLSELAFLVNKVFLENTRSVWLEHRVCEKTSLAKGLIGGAKGSGPLNNGKVWRNCRERSNPLCILQTSLQAWQRLHVGGAEGL